MGVVVFSLNGDKNEKKKKTVVAKTRPVSYKHETMRER